MVRILQGKRAEAGWYHHPEEHSLCESLWLHPVVRCFMGNQGPNLSTPYLGVTLTQMSLLCFSDAPKALGGSAPCRHSAMSEKKTLQDNKVFSCVLTRLENGAQTPVHRLNIRTYHFSFCFRTHISDKEWKKRVNRVISKLSDSLQ